MSAEHFIDEDINYNVKINVKKFKNPKSHTIKSTFGAGMARFFNTPEEMCEFMTEVGNNHPDGINMRYLLSLITHYTTSKALSGLEEKGMIASSTNEEGETIYTLTELGRSITEQLEG